MPGHDVVREFPVVDEILSEYANVLGEDAAGYRAHVHRVLNFFLALSPSDGEPPEHVAAVAALHDLGIWTDRTFDYLEPSARLANAYCSSHGLHALADEVTALIMEHHKLRRYRGPYAENVERFRRADLVDLSFGVVRFGLPAPFVAAVRAAFPDAGFHRRLVQLTGRELLRNPLRPLPMLRW